MGQSFALRPLRWVVASTSVAALAAMSMYAIAQQKPRVLEAAGTKTGVTPAELKTMWDLNPKLGGPEKGLIPGATVERELSNGQVRRVRGSVAVPGASNAVDAATKFLQAHQEILGLSTTLAELKLNSQVESLTGFHVRYDQQIAGLQAFGGGLSVHLDKNLNVVLVNHDLLPVSGSAKTVVRPQNPDAAIAAAVAAVPGAGPATVPMVEPGTLVQNGSVVSAWRVTFDTTVPAAAWEVMVDGLTGRVLRKRNIACYIDGSGLVFLPNPVQTSGVAGLADNNDADSTALNNERKTVVLQGLTGAGNQLTGEFADTSPSTAITRANEGTRVFNYPRSDDRFEEVMSYYHIDTIARYAQSLGFTNVQNRQTKVNVNGITDDNSFYSPSTKQITMGTGGVDDAEDADIIWHEAGHAIHDNQVPGWGATMEGRAMGEGFGDYWAGSYAASLGGPMSPGWDVFVGKWDGVSYNPGTPASLRRLDSNKKYPANIVNQEHADGEIWSATLWQIRTLVGRARADKMILESHFSLSTTAGFVDGANAILAANQALFNGQDQAGIRDIFVQRGILTVPVESFSISGAVTEGGSNLNGATVTLSRTLTSPYTETVTPNLLIPDNNATGVQAPLDMPANATITGVKIGVNISHSWRGDLRISVIHPDGTTVRLKDENPGDDNSNVLASYPDQDTPVQSLNVFNGKQAQGIWKLQVSDHADLDTGKINSFSVTVSFGSGTMTRQVTTTNGSYSFANLSAGTYTVTPSMAGKTFAPANRTVSVGPSAPGQDFAVSASVLESVGVTPSTIVGGNQATGTVTVAPAAPTGGLSVTLSSNSSALIVPATATIPGGATSGNFVVNTSNVASQVTRTITASLSGVTKTVNVTVTPGPVLSSFSLNPTTVVGGNPVVGTVTLSAPATTGGVVVNLAASTSVILPPQTMTVPEGQTSGTVNIPTAQVYSTATRQVSASRGGITKVANLTLEPGFVVLSVTVNPSTVDGGKSTTGAVRLSQNAPAGGSQVEVWSNSSVVVVPSTVTVTAGNSSALFTVATKNVGATSVRQVYARFGGVTRQCNLTINPAVLLSTLTVNPSTVKGGTNTTGTVTLTNPAPAGGTVVNLTSNSTALTVPATVTVPQGASTATFTITTARVGSTFTRTITASREGINRSANVTLTP